MEDFAKIPTQKKVHVFSDGKIQRRNSVGGQSIITQDAPAKFERRNSISGSISVSNGAQKKVPVSVIPFDNDSSNTLIKLENAVRLFSANPNISFEELLEMLRKAGFSGSIHSDENVELKTDQKERAWLISKMQEAVEVAKNCYTVEVENIRNTYLSSALHEQGCLAAQVRVLATKVSMFLNVLKKSKGRKISPRPNYNLTDKIRSFINSEINLMTTKLNSDIKVDHKYITSNYHLWLNAANLFDNLNDGMNSPIIETILDELRDEAQSVVNSSNNVLLSNIIKFMEKYANWQSVLLKAHKGSVGNEEDIEEKVNELESLSDTVSKKLENKVLNDKLIDTLYSGLGSSDLVTIQFGKNLFVQVNWRVTSNIKMCTVYIKGAKNNIDSSKDALKAANINLGTNPNKDVFTNQINKFVKEYKDSLITNNKKNETK